MLYLEEETKNKKFFFPLYIKNVQICVTILERDIQRLYIKRKGKVGTS